MLSSVVGHGQRTGSFMFQFQRSLPCNGWRDAQPVETCRRPFNAANQQGNPDATIPRRQILSFEIDVGADVLPITSVGADGEVKLVSFPGGEAQINLFRNWRVRSPKDFMLLLL